MSDLLTTAIIHDGDNMIERRSQDVAPTLERVKRHISMGETGSSEMKHAARIPKAVIENYCARLGITFHEWCGNPVHIKAMLNDPELNGFRIWPGRV